MKAFVWTLTPLYTDKSLIGFVFSYRIHIRIYPDYDRPLFLFLVYEVTFLSQSQRCSCCIGYIMEVVKTVPSAFIKDPA